MKPFYKTFFLLFLNIPFLAFNSFSQQAPGIEWQNTIGGSSSEYLYCIKQTTDGGYILGGTSTSDSSGDKTENSNGYEDYWIIKLDSSGMIQWQNTIGGNNEDIFNCISQTADGGYIVGGSSNSDTSGDKTENHLGFLTGSFDFWVVKLDSSGNVEWDNTIGGDGDDYLYSVLQTYDGGYILSGSSLSGISYDKTETSHDGDVWIVKINSLGVIQWQNTIGGNSGDGLFLYSSLNKTLDGGYVVGAYSASNISYDKTENCIGNQDYWVIKLDSLGSIEWQNTIGGSDRDQTTSIENAPDGGYLVGGFSKSNASGDKTENCMGPWDYWVVKIDSIGTIQWQNTIGGSDDDNLMAIIKTSDKGYALAGSSASNISGDKTENSKGASDFWLIKIDSLGNIRWQKTIGGNDDDALSSVQQTSDGGYILGGTSNSNISGDKTENSMGDFDYWIVKLLPDTITSTFNIQHSAFNINISPNPSSGIFQITFPSSKQKTNYTLEVVNTLGQTVYTSPPAPLQKRGESSALSLDLSFLPKGIYVLKINDGENFFSKKLVIQ